MKFTNLVVRIGFCELGEIVRLSRSNVICKVIEKNLFSVTVQLLSGSGISLLSVSQNVHRKVN